MAEDNGTMEDAIGFVSTPSFPIKKDEDIREWSRATEQLIQVALNDGDPEELQIVYDRMKERLGLNNAASELEKIAKRQGQIIPKGLKF